MAEAFMTSQRSNCETEIRKHVAIRTEFDEMEETNDDFVSVIVLAAGLSTRFGRNKLLEPIGRITMIECVVSESLRSKARQVIVVGGHDFERIEPKAQDIRL